RQVVGRDQPRAERARAIEILAHHPLRRLERVFAPTAVVEYRIAQDMVQGVLPGYPFTGLADNDGQLALLVKRWGKCRVDQRLAMSHDARIEAGKQRGVRWLLEPAFLGVINVID